MWPSILFVVVVVVVVALNVASIWPSIILVVATSRDIVATTV